VKCLTSVLLAGALVALILQPVGLPFNTQFDNNSLRADGMPPPPFPPDPRMGPGADGLGQPSHSSPGGGLTT